MPDDVVFSAGHGFSSVGGWMQKPGVSWLARELTHSPAWVGAIALSDLFSALWVAPLAGAVTDRSDPFRLILLTQTLLIGLALLLAGLTLALGFAVLARPFVELFPAIAGEVLRGGPETLSMLMTAQGLGALAGALFMLRPKSVEQTVRVTFGAALDMALSLIVFSLSRQLHTVCNIGMQTMSESLSINHRPSIKAQLALPRRRCVGASR